MSSMSLSTKTLQQVSNLGCIFGVWAHPDDETFMIGGLMAAAAANGQVVHCVTATKGEAGVQNAAKWPAATLAETRAREQEQAMQILGVPAPKWLNYHDGECEKAPQAEAIEQLIQLIELHKPDTIITFAPDGLTGHPDHIAVSYWTTEAVKRSHHKTNLYYAVQTQESYEAFWQVVDDKFNVYFATDSPVFTPQSSCDMLLLLEPEIAAKKTAALKAMPSQFEAIFEFLGYKGVQAAVGSEALLRIK